MVVTRKIYREVIGAVSHGKANPVATPLACHFNLSSKQSPTSEFKKEKMHKVPYASVVGSLMYAMVCTRANIAHVIGIVSRYMENP